MNDKDKHFIERYEELLDKGYCDCNEMNCIDNNSPRRILNIVKQLQSNWNSLREYLEWTINDYNGDIDIETRNIDSEFLRGISWGAQELLDKMNELESSDNK